MSTNQKEDYQRLITLSDQYYNTGVSGVSDAEFDSLVEQYNKKYNEEFVYLGQAHHQKTKLPIQMSSLKKCKDDESLERFANAEPKVTKYIYTEKLDGVSLLIHYTDEGIKLFTRGDGEYGSDVTHLLKWINIPKGDALKSMIVRGELVIPKKHVETFGDNLRNIVSGVVNAKKPDTKILKECVFVAHNIPNNNQSPSECFKTLRQLKFKIPQIVVSHGYDIDECNKVLTKFEQNTDYFIDGAVVAKDIYQPIINADNPKHVIAFKRGGLVKETTVIQVLWQDSRYGTIHPRVQIEPVEIDGCKISYCSGFHAQYIKENNIGPGSIIEVQRSGGVIPDITKVIKATTAQLPNEGTYEWEGVHIKLKEQSSSQMVARLTHSLKILEAKGISEQTVEKLYNAGFTNEFLLWNMKKEDVLKIDGFKDKSAQNIIDTLQSSRKNLTPLKALLMSACFSNFGEKKLQAITTVIDVSKYLQTNYLSDAEVANLCANVKVKTMTENFINGCKEFKKNVVFMNLLQESLGNVPAQVEEQPTEPTEPKELLKIAFTGFRPDKAMKEKMKEKGMEMVDTVTKSTRCLVIKETTEEYLNSSKAQTAQRLGIMIKNIHQFRANLKWSA
jgi:DNA ligase (NAD+)